MKKISIFIIILVVLQGCFEKLSTEVTTKNSSTQFVATDVELQQLQGQNLQQHFQQGLDNLYTKPNDYQNYYGGRGSDLVSAVAEDAASADGAATTNSAETNFSETNVQTDGIAERDRMQRIDSYIYLTTDNYQTTNGSDIIAYQINSTVVSSTQIATYPLDFYTSGIYKHQSGEQQQLLAMSSNNYGYFSPFIDIAYGYQQNNSAQMQRFAFNNGVLTKNGHIEVDGSLVTSRVIGDNLYMVVNYSPSLELPHFYPDSDSEYAANKQYISQLTNQDILPKVKINDAEVDVLAYTCYASESDDANYNISTVVLLRVKLDEATPVVDGQCYVGSTRVIYVSFDGIYLATSIYSDTELYSAMEDRFSPSYIETIEVQRFKIEDDGSLNYGGTGQVLGSLGWDADKASFHFSEQNGHLAIVTYLYKYTRNIIVENQLTPLDYYIDSQEPTPVLLSILNVDTMQRVAQLPNASSPQAIGKPDEDLYSVRYIGDQLNLVTFRKVDPLYNIDLSNILQPKITAELEITGYSNYLHPIGDDLILGVGKEAIAATDSDWGDANFAWYQGVQLSLFQRSEDGDLSLVDKVIIGERGSNTPVEYNHHAFSFLADQTYTFALPIAVHDRPSSYQASEPAAQFYNWTKSELQIYRVITGATPTLQLFDSVLADEYQQQTNSSDYNRGNVYNDRSILSTNGAFYIHQNTILTKKY